MATNDFLPFAVGTSANVTAQATYAANTTLTQNGFISGIAKSTDLNKVWRQSSIMSAVLAQFIVNQTGANATDDGTTATLLANLTAAVQASSRGAIGSRTNLKGSCVAGATTLTLAIDGLIVGTALAGLQGLVSGSLTLNLATTGAGGMDTGTATAIGWLAVYAIKNPATGAQALLGQIFAAAGVPTTIYSGSNMPSGYTMSALACVVQVSATVGQLAAVLVNGRRTSRQSGNTFTSSTATNTPTAVGISGACPGNAVRISGEIAISSTATASVGFSISADAAVGLGAQNVSGNVGTAGGIGNFQIDLLVPQTVYYTGNVSTGTPTYNLIVNSFEI